MCVIAYDYMNTCTYTLIACMDCGHVLMCAIAYDYMNTRMYALIDCMDSGTHSSVEDIEFWTCFDVCNRLLLYEYTYLCID